jgi:molybdate transport system substrate-binding protein
VFAAASLTKTFTGIGQQFQTDNPGTSVQFSVLVAPWIWSPS